MLIKNKKIAYLLTSLVLACLLVNSCKKDSGQAYIQTLFTNGTWQLASVQVFHYLGSSQVGQTDTLNTMCDSTQLFTFAGSTCTYTNFDCIPQPKASGTWTLSHDQLFLMANLLCTDTLTGGKVSKGQPFAYAKIVNLGQYSLVLQTGDIATYFTATTKRTIIQYGFVRQTLTGH